MSCSSPSPRCWLAARTPPGPGWSLACELLPGRIEPAELLSVRRDGSYLFLRYAMRGTAPAAEPSGG